MQVEAATDRKFRKNFKPFKLAEFNPKSCMVRVLGKFVLPQEMDMGKWISEDPGLAKRVGTTQEALAADFQRTVDFFKSEMGCNDQVAAICASRLSNGVSLQFKGKPKFPSNEDMLKVIDWYLANANVERGDGSLRILFENYPFALSKPIDELEASRMACPKHIDFGEALSADPTMIDAQNAFNPGAGLD